MQNWCQISTQSVILLYIFTYLSIFIYYIALNALYFFLLYFLPVLKYIYVVWHSVAAKKFRCALCNDNKKDSDLIWCIMQTTETHNSFQL